MSGTARATEIQSVVASAFRWLAGGEAETGLATAGKMPALRVQVQLLDYRHLAVGDAKAQALRVALRYSAALRNHDRILASGFDCSRHASAQQGSLQSAPAKLG